MAPPARPPVAGVSAPSGGIMSVPNRSRLTDLVTVKRPAKRSKRCFLSYRLSRATAGAVRKLRALLLEQLRWWLMYPFGSLRAATVVMVACVIACVTAAAADGVAILSPTTKSILKRLLLIHNTTRMGSKSSVHSCSTIAI